MATATKTKPASRKGDYSAKEITHLKGLDGVRKRPAMYVGDEPSSAALTHLLVEVLDNAIDEAAEGHADKIQVKFHKDGSYSVKDNGRGIPCGALPGDKAGRTALEVVFTELHAGGKFGTKSYGASGGLHGVGISVVNALSSKVRIVVARDARKYKLDFQHQNAGYFKRDGTFTALPKRKRALRSTSAAAAHNKRGGKTGTEIRFWADRSLFAAEDAVDFDEMVSRVQGLSWLLPNAAFRLIDETNDRTEVIASKGGLKEGLETLRADAEPICQPIMMKVAGLKAGEKDCEVKAAFQWCPNGDDKRTIVSYVNTIRTPNGGTHLEGFERALVKVMRARIKASTLKKLKAMPDKSVKADDVLAGLVAIIQVRLPEPSFKGQTKDELSESGVLDAVNEAVTIAFTKWLGKGSGREQKSLIDAVAETMLTRYRIQQATAAVRQTTKVSKNRSKPEKLKDCRYHPDGELLLVEGDSAAGTAKRARDTDWQAVLSLRGKVINASKKSLRDVLNNAEVQSIIASLGAGVGEKFDVEAMNYKTVLLLVDADIDGSHIRALLLTLFWELMRPLITEGRVFAAQPPTHALTLEKTGEKIFCYTEEQKDDEAAALTKEGRKFFTTRFKGLGEMEDSELAVTCLDVETRVLRQITAQDAAKANEQVELWMGNEAAARRESIMATLAK